MKKLMIVACAAVVAAVNGDAFGATTWSLPNSAYGETVGIQLTNVVKMAQSGDTIKFAEGTHDLGEVYMHAASYSDGKNTGNSLTHVYPNGKALTIIGDTSEHWSGKVVLTGKYRFYRGSEATVIKGITFSGFSACTDNTITPTTSGNLNDNVLGGAICGGITVTNCVFIGNTARSAGAVKGTTCRDCLFSTNSVAYSGGAALNGKYYSCKFEGNSSKGSSGAIWWPSVIDNCDFIGNHASGSGGAISGSQATTYSNCRFYGNYSASSGGAISSRQRTTYKNMVFVGNYSSSGGGAINADDTSSITDTQNGGRNVKVIDCVFSNNYVKGTTVTSGRGGAICASVNNHFWPVSIVNCKFVGNNAKYRGGAVYGGLITNCVFEANYLTKAKAGGTYDSNNLACGGAVAGYAGSTSNQVDIYKCTFISNYIACANYAVGGAIYSEMKAAKCENCAFIGNCVTNVYSTDNKGWGKIVYSNKSGADAYRLVGCVFTNNSVEVGGIVNNAIVTNCVFSGNDTPKYGACVKSCTVYNSRFIDNRKTTRYYKLATYNTYDTTHIDVQSHDSGVDAYASKLYDCELDGGNLNHCVLNGCKITKCNADGTWCAFGNGNHVTNTLISGVGGGKMRAVIYRWGRTDQLAASNDNDTWTNEFVNCTFADNIYSAASSKPCLISCGYPQTDEFSSFHCRFLNCAFNNNRKANSNGAVADLSAAVTCSNHVTSVYADIIVASNCVFGVAPTIVDHVTEKKIYDYNNQGGNQVLAAANQQLVKTAAEIARFGVPKYTPKARSVLRGVGDASIFASGAKDLAGNDRVVDGKVDIGCYQSYLPRLGTLIMMK